MSQLDPRQHAVEGDPHAGDIKGAFGTVRLDAEAPRSFRHRLLALAAIIGPGIIVMVGDNDAGGVATYSQAGQQYGVSLLWILVPLIPVLIVNQEMVVRLGAVTGQGHAKMIFERFGRSWGYFAVSGLFLLSFMTLVTEFIGVSLALGYFGISSLISVPAMGILLVAATASGSFARWERLMFLFIFANLLIIPLAFMSHPRGGDVLHGLVVPGVSGGLNRDSVFLMIAIVGTTVAPWQLYFQQSNIVDKRITPRWITYERFDTMFGSLITALGALAIIVTCAFAFGGTRYFGHFVDAGDVAAGLGATLHPAAGAMYAVVLLNSSLIGAAALALATSYAVGDTFGVRHSLHWTFSEARGFYASFTGLITLAAVIVLIPHAPLGLITTGVQVLAGILLPSACTFLLVLCNDRAVLGPWVNPTWLNAVAAVIIGVLIVLSAMLTVSTIYPSADVVTLTGVLFGVLVLALLGGGVWLLIRRREPSVYDGFDRAAREAWTMSPAALLERPPASRARTIALGALSVYVAISVGMLAVRGIQIALGH